MQSKATTVAQYLAGLPADRRAAISAVRNVVLKNLDKDYEEGMSYGMIGYCIPHRIYPAGYHCDPKQPLPFACLASQKNYMSLYMMCVYGDGDQLKRFQEAWAKTGKKLDMGKSCIRFKKVEDLALDVIADVIKRMTTKKYIAVYESAIKSMVSRKTTGKAGQSRSARKPAKTAKPSRKKS